MGDRTRREYVRKFNKKFLDCVSECAKNVIKGNVPLTDRQKTHLHRRRNDLRSLSIKKTSLRKERKILQKGGFLAALLPPVLFILGSLLSEVIQAAKKLVLVDEFDREYKQLQKPADTIAKTGRSLQLSDTLRDQSVADDRKVREYVAALHRYLNARKDVPSEASVKSNPLSELTPAPPPLQRSKRRRSRQFWVPY